MNRKTLKVSLINRPTGLTGKCRLVASIRLNGIWIEALGFTHGSRSVVTSEPGLIVVLQAALKEGEQR